MIQLPNKIDSVTLIQDKSAIEINNELCIEVQKKLDFKTIWCIANGMKQIMEFSKCGVPPMYVLNMVPELASKTINTYWQQHMWLYQIRLRNFYHIFTLPQRYEITKDYIKGEKDVSDLLKGFFKKLFSKISPEKAGLNDDIKKRFDIHANTKLFCIAPGANIILVPPPAIQDTVTQEPSKVFPHMTCCRVPYLQYIKEAMKIAVKIDSEPFRSAILESDINDRWIHQDKHAIQNMKKNILAHTLSMLESKKGTGKTVFVRCLAYDLWIKNKIPVYFFDCATRKPFDPIILVQEIKEVDGVCIIENIQVQPRTLQILISELGYLDKGHILFTSRPLPKEEIYLPNEYAKQLNFIPALQPIKYANKIIDYFTKYILHESISAKNRNQILELSENNYRFLIYALQGYHNKQGKGDYRAWVQAGVEKELAYLEHGFNEADPQFPEVIVLLSRLYRHCILTEESYLVRKLRIPVKTLRTLVELGEIQRIETKDGIVYYGLQDCLQAEAYWRFGVCYRRRLGYVEEDGLIHDYAIYGTPNGLEAILRASQSFQHAWDNLSLNEKIRVVELEQSNLTISLCIQRASNLELSEHMLQILAEKISSSHDFYGSGELLFAFHKNYSELFSKLWESVEKVKLSDNLIRTNDYDSMQNFLMRLKAISEDLPSELKWDISAIAEGLMCQDLGKVALVTGTICFVHPMIGAQLCEQLLYLGIANRLSDAHDIEGAGSVIGAYHLSLSEVQDKLLESVNLKNLANNMKYYGTHASNYRCMSNIYMIDRRRAEEMLDYFAEIDSSPDLG